MAWWMVEVGHSVCISVLRRFKLVVHGEVCLASFFVSRAAPRSCIRTCRPCSHRTLGPRPAAMAKSWCLLYRSSAAMVRHQLLPLQACHRVWKPASSTPVNRSSYSVPTADKSTRTWASHVGTLVFSKGFHKCGPTLTAGSESYGHVHSAIICA